MDEEARNDQSAESKDAALVDNLIHRAKTLLSELETLRNRLRDLRQDGAVEIAHFRSTVQSELGMLERLSQRLESESTKHVARSSNLPFLETVWSTAKRSKDLMALLKRVYLDAEPKDNYRGLRQKQPSNDRTKKKRVKCDAVTIDAITNGGRTWTKISLVTNTRLLFDLAKQGWDSGGSEDEEGTTAVDRAIGSDDDPDIPLLKTAKELTRAANLFRVRTKQPSVQLILPRIGLGETTEIDNVIENCRMCGAAVFCGDDAQPLPALVESLESMAPDPISTFSETLNIDCTILLALVSEFSHAKVSKEPWFHTALQRQVDVEDNENLLPSLLYPALGSHDLVCTQEAAKRMREIVDTIGTPSEKARTAILMGDDESKTQEQNVKDVQSWSAYDVPAEWKLPIRIVDQNADGCQSSLPSVATRASANMTPINKSVFLYGWATGLTTITSNRQVFRDIENKLEEFEDLADSVWPSIWLCPTARSLVGKEKRGVKKEDKRTGGWTLPDPVTREEQRQNGLDVLSDGVNHEVEDWRVSGY